jgi:predicted cobalt transporter CbtA
VSFGAFTVLAWLFYVLGVAAFVLEVWALTDAIRRPTPAFPAAGKQTKVLWLVITSVAVAIGLYAITYGSGFSPLNILEIAAFIAAAIYLTDVRPKVREMGSGGSSRQGPYGPW